MWLSGIGGAAWVGVFIWLWVKAGNFSLHWVKRPGYRIIPGDKVDAEFERSGGTDRLKHGFWHAEGGGKDPDSKLTRRAPITSAFAISCVFYPMIPTGTISNYWRAGIRLRNPDTNAEVAVAHIDNHRVFCGAVLGKSELRIPQSGDFENRWVDFSVQVGAPHGNKGQWMMYAKVDDNLYCIGEIGGTEFPGWIVEIGFWSAKWHSVAVGEIAITPIRE